MCRSYGHEDLAFLLLAAGQRSLQNTETCFSPGTSTTSIRLWLMVCLLLSKATLQVFRNLNFKDNNPFWT
ncbi:uncharacterized protein EAE97_009077 [Botrytis byssoidea]|uniref:Uncharacterized protein n=1 Tax=Botrytis byssoidea TaxID=139641 RepID=A0A9P5I988_9HELO|nr:uncharacterized protein EAE97_009077 [Botrytis byssoidea]KAF7932056.1 hypothetical protein EAE97_009077 [Botrytis byssoidea]